LLNRQHSSVSGGVTFDIKSISDDESVECLDAFQSHGASVQDHFDAANLSSNFSNNRHELNSGRNSMTDSLEGALNLDTQTNDEVIRKM
jgi:hypothetical protein